MCTFKFLSSKKRRKGGGANLSYISLGESHHSRVHEDYSIIRLCICSEGCVDSLYIIPAECKLLLLRYVQYISWYYILSIYSLSLVLEDRFIIV